MTQPGSEPKPVPEGYEGYTPPVPPPSAGGQYPPVQHPQPPYQGQQPQPPYQGQQQSYPAGPQQPYPAPQAQYQQPYGQMQQPYPAYGHAQPKSKLVAGLLGIFLGGLGIHRFYLGYTKIGILQLVLSIVLSSLSFPVVAVWGLIEGIMILTGSTYFRTDARGIPLRG